MKKETKQQPTNRIAVAIGVIAVIFLGGVMTGTQLTKAPKTEVKTVTVEKNAEAWHELKAIDDEMLKASVKQTQLCSATVYAASAGDSGTLKAVEGDSKENKAKFDIQTEARKNVLKTLGY